MTEVAGEDSETVAKKPETTDHEKPREKKERIRPSTKVKLVYKVLITITPTHG